MRSKSNFKISFNKIFSQMNLLLMLTMMLMHGALFANQKPPKIDVLYVTQESIDHIPEYPKVCKKETLTDFCAMDEGYAKTVFINKNFPINKKIHFYIQRSLISEKYVKQGEYTMKEGEMIDDEPAFSICIPSKEYLPGESILCKFTTTDSTFEIEKKVIPNPLKTKNKSGVAEVELELVMLKPLMVYKLNFSGFRDQEPIEFFCISGKDKIGLAFKVGKEEVSFTPNVVRETGVISKCIIIRATGEKMQLVLPSGKAFDKYVLEVIENAAHQE